MSPEQKLERMAKREMERDAQEDKKIVQFQVVGPVHNMMIYALLADGTLWRQWRSTVLEPMNWERIGGPS